METRVSEFLKGWGLRWKFCRGNRGELVSWKLHERTWETVPNPMFLPSWRSTFLRLDIFLSLVSVLVLHCEPVTLPGEGGKPEEHGDSSVKKLQDLDSSEFRICA